MKYTSTTLILIAAGLIANQSAHAQVFDVNTSGSNIYEAPTTGGAQTEVIPENGYGRGLAYSNGDLFVSQIGNTGDGGNGSDIYEYNVTGATPTQVTTFNVLNQNDPVFMTVDGPTLYVAERSNSTSSTAGSINAYNTQTGLGGAFISSLYQPQGIAAYNGDLYVALNNGGGAGTNGSIAEYSEQTGLQVGSFSLTGLSEPQGIAIENGDLYVANEGTNQVFEYSLATDAKIGTFAAPTNPYGITKLPNGNLVVTSDGPGSSAYEYDAGGDILSTNYLLGSSYALDIVDVPEPSTWALLGLVAAVGFFFRRRLNA